MSDLCSLDSSIEMCAICLEEYRDSQVGIHHWNLGPSIYGLYVNRRFTYHWPKMQMCNEFWLIVYNLVNLVTVCIIVTGFKTRKVIDRHSGHLLSSIHKFSFTSYTIEPSVRTAHDIRFLKYLFLICAYLAPENWGYMHPIFPIILPERYSWPNVRIMEIIISLMSLFPLGVYK